MIEVPPHERRTALLVQVPVAEAVDDFRRRHLAASVARGIPAHVTVLFPFAGAASIDAELRAQVVEHFATFSGFSAELARVDRFDAHVWLAPEPHEQFIALLAGTHARFPQFPPYGEDAFAEPVPHLPIAETDPGGSVDQLAAEAERELGAELPFTFAVQRISLIEELADGTWQQSDSFELG